MTETLLEEVNPNGNVQAIVESDDDTRYFYLFAPHAHFGDEVGLGPQSYGGARGYRS